MKKLHPEMSLEELCGLFGYSRQNYYKIKKRRKKRKAYEADILERVKKIREEQHRLGTIKLQYKINKELEEGSIGRDKLYSLLRSENMLVRKRKRYHPKETDGNGESIYPDLRKGLKVERINQLWCSDITYIELRTKERHCYLICITDEYSHLIVGYNIGLRMRTAELLEALKEGLNSELKKGEEEFNEPLIFHSDRGSQYKSNGFQAICKKHNIISSMTERGKSYENPVAERLNGILKNELLTQDSFDSFEEAKKAIERVIKIYNEKRPHLSCNLLTPKEAHEENGGPLKKLWRQRKKSKDKNRT